MKKIKTLTMLLICSVVISSVESCSKQDEDPITQAFWEGAMHGFTDVQITLDDTNDLTIVHGGFENGGTLNLYVDATQTGTYTLGGSNSTASLNINNSNGSFYSYGTGATGNINITKIDRDKKWIEMNFSGTLVNQANNAQTLDVTQGTIRKTFAF